MEQNEVPIEGKLLTKNRRHKQDRLLKRLNVGLEADFKKKKEDVYKKMDIEAESMPEGVSEGGSTEDQLLELENQAGLEGFNHLQKNRVAHIGEGTQFSDGAVVEDGYLYEPSLEDLLRIEAEEKKQAEQLKKEMEFEFSKTGGGKRAGSQKVRGLR